MTDNKDALTVGQDNLRDTIETILLKTKGGEPKAIAQATEELLCVINARQTELEAENRQLLQTQTALEHAAAHFTDLYDFAPVSYLTVDLDGVIQELNLTAAALLKLDRNAVTHRRFSEFISDDYQEVWNRHFDRVKQKCEQQGCELPFGGGKNPVSFYHLNCQYLPCAPNAPELFRITLTDVTERRRAETKLRENEAVFSILVDHAPSGMLVVDNQLRLTNVNKLGLPVFKGIDPLVDRQFDEIMEILWEEKVAHSIVQVFEHTLATGQRFESTNFTETRRDTGIQEAYEWETQRITLPDGSFGVACYFTDITERNKRDEDLRIASVAFETQEGIYVTDHHNVIQRVNKAFTRITGYQETEAIGKNPVFLRADPGNETYQAALESLKQHSYWEGELCDKRKNGEIYPVWLTKTAVKDDDGKVTHFVAAINDITVHKLAEAARRERNDRDRLRLFVEQIPAAVAMLDTEMLYLAASERWKTDYRINLDYLGHSHYAVFPEIPERRKKIHRRALSGETLSAREDQFQRQDGSTQWVNWIVTPWRKASGEIGGIVILTEEITERKRVEELSIAAAAFETQDSIAIADANKKIQRVNKAYCRVTGFSADEAAHRPFFCSESDNAGQYAPVWASIVKDGYWRGELWETRKNGEPFLIAANITAVTDALGQISHYVADFIDITERHKIEQALRWSEELNRKILQAFPAHIAVIDAQGKIIAVNEAWTKFAETNADARPDGLTVGANYLEICRHSSALEDDNAISALNGIEAILSGNTGQFVMEYPCHTKCELRWFSMIAVQFIQNGNVGAVIAHQDITERKRIELALRESEARYLHLLENQTDVICRFKSDNTMVYVNEAFCRLFGKSKAELEGNVWHPVVYPEDVALVNEKLSSLTRSDPIVTIENRIIAAGGKVRWGQFVNRGFFDHNGQLLETQAVGRDITERKYYEAQLRIAAAAFDTQESIMITDTHKTIQRVNKAFTRITGYSAMEAMGKTPKFMRSDLHDQAFYDHLLETVANEGFWQGEIWNKRKNGEIYPVLQTITAVTDEQGNLTHYVGAMIDITVQKQAEKVLLEARKRLESQVVTTQDELDKVKAETSEINVALNVLLRQRETDKTDVRLAFTHEVEATVLPLLKKLKTISTGRLQTVRLIKLLEENLELLAKSYGRGGTLAATYQKLTPIETQVASMIRQGQPTKVIAAALNIATGTVSIHRKHIRKKLGLDGKKDNLHSYLLSLTE